MIVFLLALSVICVLTGACQTPQCTVKNDTKAYCTVERKDLTRANHIKKTTESREFFVMIYNTSSPETNASWKITSKVFRKSRTGKYSTTSFDIRMANLPWKYFVTVRNSKKNAKTDLDLFLSCLAYSKQTDNVTAEVRFRHPIGRQFEKSDIAKSPRNRNTNTQKIAEKDSSLPSTSLIQHALKESPASVNQNQCESHNNCTVNLQTKTIKFWCKKPNHNTVTKCGIVSSNFEFITGEFKEDPVMGFCSTTYNKTESYYTRMYFAGVEGKSQCRQIEINIRAIQAKRNFTAEVKHRQHVQRQFKKMDTVKSSRNRNRSIWKITRNDLSLYSTSPTQHASKGSPATVNQNHYESQSNFTAGVRLRQPVHQKFKKDTVKSHRNRNRSTWKITTRNDLSLPSTSPTQHASKKSPATVNENQCESQNNCTVNLQTKTIKFWCKKPNHNTVTKCGIVNANFELITGEFKEDPVMGFCSTTYNKTESYYTRMYFAGGEGSSQCRHIEINIRALLAKHVRMLQRNDDSIDTRETVVLIFLLSALIPLSVFVVVLYCSRRRLQHVIKVKTDDYFSPTEQTDPRVMIVTIDEYNTDISQLIDLLVGEKINVVTLASHAQENMMSRHDWLELTVNECNHFIFIVTKPMEETLNMLNKKWSVENNGEGERDLLIDYERGTCAYTIALIRNKFIKSLKCSGKFVESCHLVSFEDIDLKNVLHPTHGRELFPCIKTHHYCLYSKQRFQFHHARRIVRNILKIEKHRPKRNSKDESSTKRSSNEGMDIEKAFASMSIYSNPNVIPNIQIENESDIDTDFDVACDLLIENHDRLETV